MNINSDLETAKTLIEAKKYHEAEHILTSAITVLEKGAHSERDIQLSEAYNNIGFVLYKKVEFVKALSFFNKAIELNFSFAPAYYNRGLIHYRLGSFETGRKDLEKAVMLEPNNQEFSIGLKEILDVMKSSCST